MIDNRCPSCRWRVMHERPVVCIEGVGKSRFPCCHGGSPVTIHGDFPFCPEPPYDFCAAFAQKEPVDARAHQPDYPEDGVPMPDGERKR